jgi:ADP-glucose pyrophosphorylase
MASSSPTKRDASPSFWKNPRGVKSSPTQSTPVSTCWSRRCWITSPTACRTILPANCSRRMLAEQAISIGYVADGYWCDVGNINEYMRANADVLYGASAGRADRRTPGRRHLGGRKCRNLAQRPTIWPDLPGQRVKIKGDVRIYGPAVIRDYTVIDNYNRIERSIIWRNNYVGESCELRGRHRAPMQHQGAGHRLRRCGGG